LEVFANGRLDRQAFAAFGTPCAQDFTSTASTHAGTKTMGTLAFDYTGLKRSFHGRIRDCLSCTPAAFSCGGKGGKITVLAGLCQPDLGKNKLKQQVTKM